MAEYSELDSLIGKIKRAAIDVYMTSPENYYEIEGDRYRYRGSGRGMTQWCTRPGEDGQGGGDVSMDGMPDFLVNHLDDDFRNAFDTVRDRVDEVFADLKDIPRGDMLFFEEERSMEAAQTLTPQGASTALPPGGGSALELNNAVLSQRVNAIHGYCYRLSSQTIDAFRLAYADRLGAILDGQAALAAMMGMAAAGQRAVFKKAQEDVAALAGNALSSLEALAGQQASSGGPSGGVFAVGGALLSIAGLGSGPGAVAFAAAGAVSGLISDLWPDKPDEVKVSLSGSDLDGMLQSMHEVKGKLLQAAVDDETVIQSALVNASGAVRESPGSFDLSRPSYPPAGTGREQVGGPGTIEHNYDDMQRLAATCQLVSDIVDEASGRVAGADAGSGDWSRPAGIGIGTSGPYQEFSNLADDVLALTRNTAAELAEAATKLIAASLDFAATDADITRALGREMRELREAEREGDLLFD
ncbi:hypothetical protein [Nocardioides ferulae]|uniref:hypothetical protein n=1 Tax=Nocardioides ferulae TaxID=2340821 RepID=UPI000EAF7315|nr:hypothetical protein [Nocardioides ferulae]